MPVEHEQNDTSSLAVRHQFVIPRSYRTNIVSDKYEIQIDSPIVELNTEFCKYYLAVNVEDNSEYFAVVAERDFNISIPTLDKLKHYAADNGFINLLTYEVVKTSLDETYRIVAIINKYDYNATLSNYMTNNGGLDSEKIKDSLVPALVKALQFCVNYEICCGNINPQNILILDDGKFCLREFFVTPPHFFQTQAYLAPEIADCINYARHTTSIAADVYAFGITVYSVYIGVTSFVELESEENYNADRLERGTLALMTQKRKLSSSLNALVKQSTLDDPKERLEVKSILEWVSGVIAKPHKTIQVSHYNHVISFNGSSYNNLKALASSMHRHQEEALRFVDADVLQKWIQRNADKSEVAIALSKFIARGTKRRSGQANQEILFKVLSVLDYTGNIRMANLCFTCDAIPQLLLHSITSQKKQWADVVMLVITNKWWGQFISFSGYAHLRHDYVHLLLNLTNSYKHNTSSCGIERITYTLNPYFPCMSPAITDAYVVTLLECLLELEKIAEQRPEKLIIDRHLVAFMASRVGIKSDTDVRVLADFPTMSNALVSQATVLLATSSVMHSHIKLENVSVVMGQRLIELIEKNIHNIKLMKVLSDRMTDAAKDCNFIEMVAIISNTKIFYNDRVGYRKACVDVAGINKKITLLHDTQPVQELGVFLGQRVTVFISYVLCCIVTLILVI